MWVGIILDSFFLDRPGIPGRLEENATRLPEVNSMFTVRWQPPNNERNFILKNYVLTIRNMANMDEILPETTLPDNSISLNLTVGNYIFSYRAISSCNISSDIMNDTLEVALSSESNSELLLHCVLCGALWCIEESYIILS